MIQYTITKSFYNKEEKSNGEIAMTKLKECFGSQGMAALYGETVEECFNCELYDKCHKMTMSITIQGLNVDLRLITQNGLTTGRLLCMNALNEINHAKMLAQGEFDPEDLCPDCRSEALHDELS